MPSTHSSMKRLVNRFQSAFCGRLADGASAVADFRYFSIENGIVTPAMNINRGITKSQGENPSHDLWVKTSITG